MQIFEEISKILAETLGIDQAEISIDSKFSDLGADSMDVMRLVVELEKEYQISIPDQRIEQFYTLKDLIQYVDIAIAS